MTTPIAALATTENVAALLEQWPQTDTTDERFIPVLALTPEAFARRFALYVQAIVTDEHQAAKLQASVID